MPLDKTKRDSQIESMRAALRSLEYGLKTDEAIPAEVRKRIAGRNLSDVVIEELSVYAREWVGQYVKLQKQLRRLSR